MAKKTEWHYNHLGRRQSWSEVPHVEHRNLDHRKRSTLDDHILVAGGERTQRGATCKLQSSLTSEDGGGEDKECTWVGVQGRAQQQYGIVYSQHDIVCKLTCRSTHLLEQLPGKLADRLMMLLLQLWLAWAEAACWLPAVVSSKHPLS